MMRRGMSVAAVLLSGLLVACQASESPSAGTAFDYQRDIPNISSSVLEARGTVVSSSDHPSFDMAAPIADTPHAYLEPKSAAFNLIDAVRAARSFVPQLSDRWVVIGDSQGGETAWATAEYSPKYGQGLDLLGAAAIVPALDVSDVVRHAQDGNLTRDDLTLYPYVITGLAAVDPSLKLGDYLHGPMLDQRETLISCNSQSDERKSQLQETLTAADAKPSSQEAADRLAQRLADYALPQQPTSVPVLAVYGGVDQTVAPEWTETAIKKGCALGDTVLRVRVDGQGHGLDPGAQLSQWNADRFAGAPAPNNC